MQQNQKILIGLFFIGLMAFRLCYVDLPGWHKKELFQVDMSKNLVKSNFNILESKVSFIETDISWEHNPPYAWSEDFPFFNLLASIAIKIFPKDPLVTGRLLNLFIFLITCIFMFYFLKESYSEEIAFWAVILFSISPLSLNFAISFVPSIAMVCSFWAAMLCLKKYFKEEKTIYLGLVLLSTVAMMSFRYYGIFLFIPLAAFWLQEKKTEKKKLFLLITLSGIVPFLWLLYTFSYLNHTIKPGYHGGNWGIFFTDNFTFLRQMFLRVSKYGITIVGLGFTILGITSLFFKSKKDWFLLSSLPMMALSIFIFNNGHAYHWYYQYNFIPFLAILAALGIIFCLEKFPKKFHLLITFVILTSCLMLSLRQTYKLMRFDNSAKILGDKISELTEEGSKIVVVQDVPDPGVLVYGNRQGWMRHIEEFSLEDFTFLYKKAHYLAFRISRKNFERYQFNLLSKILKLQKNHLTLWQTEENIGKHEKCGAYHFYVSKKCKRARYFLAILKL